MNTIELLCFEQFYRILLLLPQMGRHFTQKHQETWLKSSSSSTENVFLNIEEQVTAGRSFSVVSPHVLSVGLFWRQSMGETCYRRQCFGCNNREMLWV